MWSRVTVRFQDHASTHPDSCADGPMAKQAHHGSSRIRRRRTACISRLCIDSKFTTLLIEAAKGASVRMPDGLNGDEILEWFSLPWDEAVRRDPTFRERHLHRPVMLRSEVAG